MLLTRQAQIAIAMLVTCARAGDRYLQIGETALGSDTTREHAAKIAYLLRRGGFITSARGRHGGIKLTLPPKAISLGAVLRHMQPPLARVAERGTGKTTALDCVIETGRASFLVVMDRFSIADLEAGRVPKRAVCDDCRLLKPSNLGKFLEPSECTV